MHKLNVFRDQSHLPRSLHATKRCIPVVQIEFFRWRNVNKMILVRSARKHL